MKKRKNFAMECFSTDIWCSILQFIPITTHFIHSHFCIINKRCYKSVQEHPNSFYYILVQQQRKLNQNIPPTFLGYTDLKRFYFDYVISTKTITFKNPCTLYLPSISSTMQLTEMKFSIDKQSQFTLRLVFRFDGNKDGTQNWTLFVKQNERTTQSYPADQCLCSNKQCQIEFSNRSLTKILLNPQIVQQGNYSLWVQFRSFALLHLLRLNEKELKQLQLWIWYHMSQLYCKD